MNYNNNTIYVSPKVKTIEIKAQNIICTSGDGYPTETDEENE